MLQLGANIHKIFFSSKSFCLKFPQILKILPVQVLKNCTARAENPKTPSPGGIIAISKAFYSQIEGKLLDLAIV